MRKKELNYVSLDSKAFLADVAYRAMSLEERGLYCHLIFILYSNGGSVTADQKILWKICDCNSLKHFVKLWEKIRNKFFQKRAKLFHKRVSRELSRVVKLSQAHSKAGVRANKIRWQTDPKRIAKESDCNPIVKGSNETKREVKGREIVSNRGGSTNLQAIKDKKTGQGKEVGSTRISPEGSSIRIDSGKLLEQKFHAYEKLSEDLRALGKSNQSALRNFVNWVSFMIKADKLDGDKIWVDIFKICKDSIGKKAKNPMAVFFSNVKEKLGYLKND